jgi:hypothetical protein
MESHFSAFLDDALSQAERRSFESHLLGCRRCSLSLREVKGALALLGDVANAQEPDLSPHFDDDLMDRIRSGEAMRPTMVEWLQGFFAFDRLRPVLATGAAAMVVVVALFVIQEQGRDATPAAPGLASGERAASEAPVPTAIAADVPVAGTSTLDAAPSRPSTAVMATAPPTASTPSRDAARTGTTPADEANGIIQVVDRISTESPAGLESAVPNPGALFADEYVTDQFYLQRTGTFIGPRQATSVPVSDRSSDDVYIEF